MEKEATWIKRERGERGGKMGGEEAKLEKDRKKNTSARNPQVPPKRVPFNLQDS